MASRTKKINQDKKKNANKTFPKKIPGTANAAPAKHRQCQCTDSRRTRDQLTT
jgi:hypothetical protein